ncbi:hypothetical protein E3U55_10580 [Filobacillus milosensis]|uniref:Uncharacterized protein n=1 Tax=Filobacillus milosensis TaxID=94137 RepID=A0A4Y8IJ32_9BACI|nr:hypothetical protein [Filobacillus milosensis]TFB19596.1 hypothetical protein E3U55_10580 [Filobacillus milosensis]
MFFWIIIIAILMLSIGAVAKVNDIQKHLEEVDENRDETIRKLNDLYKSGLLKKSELKVKKTEHKRKIYLDQLSEHLHKLHGQGLLTDDELDEKLEQLHRIHDDHEDVVKLRQETGNEDIVCLAKDLGDEWVCVCGVKNDKTGYPINCTNCNRSQQFVFNYYAKGK